MRNYDRLLSVTLISLGAALLLYSGLGSASEHTMSAVRFVGFDMLFLSWLSYLSPRSNVDFRRQAFTAARYLAISMATIGVVVVTVYLIAGLPGTVSNALLLTMLLIALPAALIVPVIAKSVHAKWSRPQ